MEALFILLAVCIFIIGVGVGVTINLDEFRHAFGLPSAIITGLASQIIFMPLVSYLIAVILDLPLLESIGLVLVGCAPGGGLSNLFCLWIDGDVSLSITMTTVSTIFASFMIPLNVLIYVKTFLGADDSISMDWGGLFGSLGIILSGTCMGMFTATKVSETNAKYIEKFGSACGLLILLAAIVVGMNDNLDLWKEGWKIYLGSGLVQPFGLLFGYCVSKYIIGLPEKLAQTISLETGLQNIALIIAIVEISFSDETIRDEVLKFPLMYSLWYIFWTLGIIIIFYFMADSGESTIEMDISVQDRVESDDNAI